MATGIEDIRVTIVAATPGNDSNDYVMVDTTVVFNGGGQMQQKGIDRAQFMVNNTQAGTLKSYWSPDKGTSWNLNSSTSVAANAAITAGPYDFSLSGFPDWKLVWTNGGVAQSPWQPTLTFSRGQKALSF